MSKKIPNEPDKSMRVQKHIKKETGKKVHSKENVHKQHRVKQEKEEHNYLYMQHLDEYEDEI